MTHMNVSPEDLTSVAHTMDQKVSTLQQIRNQVQTGVLPDGAFGHLPGLGPHMSNVYQDHVDDTMEVMSRATDGLDYTVKSLLATANGMLEMEKNTADHVRRSIPS